MALGSLLDTLRTYLGTSLTPVPPLIGSAYPIAAAELPAVTLSLSDVSERLNGLGRLPAPVVTGALRVDTSLDLANPVVTFPDEVVRLLSTDRRVVTLAHGPLVRADGTQTQPFALTDIRVVRTGTVLRPVAGPPLGGQVQVLPEIGQLRFPARLAATGVLELGYFVGQWEVRSARYGGTLRVEAFAPDAAGVEALSRQLETALGNAAGRVAGLAQLSPTAWSAVLPAAGGPGSGRGRALSYSFDYELVEPRLGTGGGLVSTISVQSTFGPEAFDVTREGS